MFREAGKVATPDDGECCHTRGGALWSGALLLTLTHTPHSQAASRSENSQDLKKNLNWA